MDNGMASKEALTIAIRDAIRHINRNLYEWTSGYKKDAKIQLTLGYNEVKGLVKNWLMRTLRDKIGAVEADRLFKGIYITMSEDNTRIKNISILPTNQRLSPIVSDILSSMSYQLLGYNPSDYIMDGMSERKGGFDPFIFVSFDSIKSIKF